MDNQTTATTAITAIPLSLVCFAPVVPTRGEELIVTFRVPPIKFSASTQIPSSPSVLSQQLAWSMTVEKRVNGRWETSAFLSGVFIRDLEIARFTVPDVRFIRVSLTHQGGSPSVWTLATHAIAKPRYANWWVDRPIVSEPCPWRVYYGRFYGSDGAPVQNVLTGYFVKTQNNLLSAVDSQGKTNGNRPFTILVEETGSVLNTGATKTYKAGSAGTPVGTYHFPDGTKFTLSQVMAPAEMK